MVFFFNVKFCSYMILKGVQLDNVITHTHTHTQSFKSQKAEGFYG